MNFIQINDVYEMTGLPAIAQYAAEQRRIDPQARVILAGDFLSPSVYREEGRQMIDVLNTMGIDYVVLGNHEFDIPPAELKARIKESKFTWLNANIVNEDGSTIEGTVPYTIEERTDATTGRSFRVALVGLSIGTGKPGFKVLPPLDTLRALWPELTAKADGVIAVTHLGKETDLELAEKFPQLLQIIGGHEHEGIDFTVGSVRVTKAKSNARDLYHHVVTPSHVVTHRVLVDTQKRHAVTAAVVDRWRDKLFADLRTQGFEPNHIIYQSQIDLDGLDEHVRKGPTNLGDLMTAAMASAVAQTDLALLSGGAIRIDDIIAAGPFTEYDLLRIIPYENTVNILALPGSMVARMLAADLPYMRLAYYHLHGAERLPQGGYAVGGVPLDPTRTYRVAMTSHLAAKLKDDSLGAVVSGGDLRRLFRDYLTKLSTCKNGLTP